MPFTFATANENSFSFFQAHIVGTLKWRVPAFPQDFESHEVNASVTPDM
jgi:hypothetical protein